MGLNLKNIFKKSKAKTVYSILNDDRAIFSSFGKDIYMSDLINNAIDRIASEISKIQVMSVVEKNGIIKQNDDLTRLFRAKPNPLQTTSDFLSCCEWLRKKDCNCFIYPQYDEFIGRDGFTYRKYRALYPLNPTSCEFGLDDTGNVWEVKFTFRDASEWIIPYSDLIHLKWRRGKNNVIGGGGDNGEIDNTDVLRSLEALDQITQGIPKSLAASLQIKGLYKAKSLVDSKKLNKTRDDFESHLLSSKTGIVATDLAGDFTPLNIKAATIDPQIMKFLKDIVRERYGISEAILSGDYTGEQHSAFYQNCVEDFINAFEQAATATLFTQREQDLGHKIKGYFSKVAYMSNTDKIQLMTIATNTALMYKDEIRTEVLGLPPIGGKEGRKFIQSLNFVDEALAETYQTGKNEKKGADIDEQI